MHQGLTNSHSRPDGHPYSHTLTYTLTHAHTAL